MVLQQATGQLFGLLAPVFIYSMDKRISVSEYFVIRHNAEVGLLAPNLTPA